MKILVMGGGPVGLSLAIYLSQTFEPSLSVVVREKRNVYARKQVLLLHPDTFSLYPKEIRDYLIEKGCALTPPPVGVGRCYQSSYTGLHSIPTYLLEQALRKYISKHTNYQVETASTVDHQDLDTFDFIFGCDGGNSYVRQEVMKIEKKVRETYYGLIVLGDPQHRKIYNKKPKPGIQKKRSPQHRYRAFATKEGDFYMGISVPKKIFDELGTGMQPLANMPPHIQKIVQSAEDYYNYDLKNAQVMSVRVENYFCKPAAKRIRHKSHSCTVALVGDSLMGAHYFGGQGLNVGLREADFIADHITSSKFISSYKRFTQNQYEKFHKNMKKVVIPFAQIDQAYSHMSMADLRKVAKNNHIRVKSSNKHELALILGAHIL